MDFDFDHWARLAAEDPERFERERAEALAGIIAEAPDSIRPRLTGLQWQLDQVRDRADAPMGACMRMYRMMWDSVIGEDGLLEALQRLARPAEPPPRRRSATVVPFPGTEPDPPA